MPENFDGRDAQFAMVAVQYFAYAATCAGNHSLVERRFCGERFAASKTNLPAFRGHAICFSKSRAQTLLGSKWRTHGVRQCTLGTPLLVLATRSGRLQPCLSSHLALDRGGVIYTFRWRTRANQIVTYYKLNTLRPCSLNVFLDFVCSRGVQATDDGTSNPLEFTDDTGTVYRMEFGEGRAAGYLNFDGTIVVKPRQRDFRQINEFVQFCLAQDLGVRRGNVEIVGPGNLASDIFSSEAYRIASYLSDQMDAQSS